MDSATADRVHLLFTCHPSIVSTYIQHLGGCVRRLPVPVQRPSSGVLYPVAPDEQGKFGVGIWVVEERFLPRLGAHADASPSADARKKVNVTRGPLGSRMGTFI